MTELRDSVVEAMAQAIESKVGDAMADVGGWGYMIDDAAADALDAALEVLGEFVEAADAGAKRADLSPLVAYGLLAVLRAGKGSE